MDYNGDNNYWFVNGQKIYKVKANNGNINFSNYFYLGSISDGFSTAESRKVSLGGNVHDVSVD